jgi:hypothetical protein
MQPSFMRMTRAQRLATADSWVILNTVRMLPCENDQYGENHRGGAAVEGARGS